MSKGKDLINSIKYGLYRMLTQYPADEEINYNPKDYEEYPDFPQSMLEPKYSPYQTV